MLIEYKIKFEKDGLTIAQHIEPNPTTHKTAANGRQQVNGLPATQTEVTARAAENPLAKVAPDGGGAPISDPGGAPISDPGGVPGSFSGSSAPIFILGPIVFGGSVPTEITKSVPPPPDSPPKALGKGAGE